MTPTAVRFIFYLGIWLILLSGLSQQGAIGPDANAPQQPEADVQTEQENPIEQAQEQVPAEPKQDGAELKEQPQEVIKEGEGGHQPEVVDQQPGEPAQQPHDNQGAHPPPIQEEQHQEVAQQPQEEVMQQENVHARPPPIEEEQQQEGAQQPQEEVMQQENVHAQPPPIEEEQQQEGAQQPQEEVIQQENVQAHPPPIEEEQQQEGAQQPQEEVMQQENVHGHPPVIEEEQQQEDAQQPQDFQQQQEEQQLPNEVGQEVDQQVEEFVQHRQQEVVAQEPGDDPQQQQQPQENVQLPKRVFSEDHLKVINSKMGAIAGVVNAVNEMSKEYRSVEDMQVVKISCTEAIHMQCKNERNTLQVQFAHHDIKGCTDDTNNACYMDELEQELATSCNGRPSCSMELKDKTADSCPYWHGFSTKSSLRIAYICYDPDVHPEGIRMDGHEGVEQPAGRHPLMFRTGDYTFTQGRWRKTTKSQSQGLSLWVGSAIVIVLAILVAIVIFRYLRRKKKSEDDHLVLPSIRTDTSQRELPRTTVGSLYDATNARQRRT